MTESTIIPAGQVSPRSDEDLRAAVARALQRPRYEVLPLKGTAELVEQHVPREFPVTVTASPRRGIESTLVLTEALSRMGFIALPHLAARQVVDEAHLREVLHRVAAAGVSDVFVIAGDSQRPIGTFSDSGALLDAMDRLRQSGDAPMPPDIGIAGYPEGHPFISDDDLLRAMRLKQSIATYVVSQMCFDANTISTWLSRIRDVGVHLPLHVGVAGAVDQRKLLRIAGRIGVGSSARFLRKHRRGLVRVLRPGGYRPDRFLQGLADDLADPSRGMAGLHVYTMGDVAATERWRRRALERLAGGTRHG